jgi:4-hydroxybenzoate polyprenyltransferase
MVCLQAAIGAANDVVDRDRDAGRKPGKPIPAGLVSVESARALAATAAAFGLALSAASGLPAAALGSAVLAIGLSYDLRLRGTAWSWLPFAVGIPLLPVYAWVGAGTRVPGVFAVLVPTAFLAGAALAVANALADVERDRDSGASSIAARLGRGRAWATHALLHGVVVAIALVTMTNAAPPPLAVAVALVGTACLGAGLAFAASSSPARRERGWELEAVGVAGLAAGWLAAVAPLSK